MGNFHGFVELVLGWKLAVDDVLLAFEGEVAVQLHHSVARRYGIGTVDLNFITALTPGETGGEECENQK